MTESTSADILDLGTESGKNVAELAPEDFDELDTLLDDMRTRAEEIPQWEFCEGFMVAVACCRRPIALSEALPVLLGEGEVPDPARPHGLPLLPAFADEAQEARFVALWLRRWDEVTRSLAAKVESLDDDATYHPEVMDIRGEIAMLPEAERAEMEGEDIPSFAQVWALGFMFTVEAWPEEWTAPRDKETARWLDDAMGSVVALTEDDTGKPEVSMLAEDGPPTISNARLDAFAEGIWAVYDLFQLWHSLGPRVEAVRRDATPGRNDACPCGSGKKYKKCHGA